MGTKNNDGKTSGEYILAGLDEDDDDISETSSVVKLEDYETATLKEIGDMMDEIDKINDKMGGTSDKAVFDNYAEQIMQYIIQLDNIDAKNYRKIREARKDAIIYAQATLQKLDEKM